MIRLATLAAGMSIAFLTGRATQSSLYSWRGYDDLLYRQYKETTKAGEMRSNLGEHTAEVEKSGKKVVPGLYSYAELGTLRLR